MTSGTNPNAYDPGSGLTITNVLGKVRVSFTATAASGTGYAGLTRYFDLLSATNLVSGLWPGVPNYTNIAGSNQLVTHTNATSTNTNFKLQIRLQ